MKRRITGLVTGTVTALLAGMTIAASAQTGGLVDVQIINRTTGLAAGSYNHASRTYVAGQHGDRFALRLTNRTPGRVLAVASVDGVNVVSGETAAPDQAGYVLGPYQSYDVIGWRKSTNDVAAFYFTTVPDSYAGRTNRPGNVGVIGLAVFSEWQAPRPRPQPNVVPSPRAADSAQNEAARGAERDTASSAPPSPASPPAARTPLARERMGTGHGEREVSQVTMTDFRRATPRPNQVTTLHYDSYSNLAARGIIPAMPDAHAPNPFPAVRFVPDPRS